MTHWWQERSKTYRPDASHATLIIPGKEGRQPMMAAVKAWATITLMDG
jgi:hypothetical protein